MATQAQLEAMVKDIVRECDEDHAKQLDERTAEDPECVADNLAALVKVARRHVNGWEKKL
jgi:hypothetical protein